MRSEGHASAIMTTTTTEWTTDEWATPWPLFERLSRQYGPFTLDAAASAENAKAPMFYTQEDDGLDLDWFGRVWVNPPYSDPRPWCIKALVETLSGRANRVVMLLPAAVDTHWFHNWVQGHAMWYPLRGRPRFLGPDGQPSKGTPKAGNVVAIYEGLK